MENKYTVEFGRPDEKERFVNIHERFFERLENLQKAIDVAFFKDNVSLEKVDLVVSVFGHICIDDFSGILLLCMHGFGDQAIAILRGMYERLVVARYLHLNPNEVDAFWNFHVVKVSKMGFNDILKKIDASGEVLDSFKVTKGGAGKKQLQNSWTNIDFVSMANKVGLGEHIRNAYRLPLEFAHPSVQAILECLEQRDGGINVKDEPRRNTAEIAFPIAHFFIIEVLRLQIEHFGLDGDDPVFQQCLKDYMYIWKEENSSTQS